MVKSNVVDYGLDSNLSEFGAITLKERYLTEGEVSPQDAFWRAAAAFSDSLEMAERMYKYASHQWMTFATPILSNAPVRIKWDEGVKWYDQFEADNYSKIPRGLPISCFLTYVDDSIDGLNSHTVESRALSVSGGGVGAHWSNVRSISDKSPGVIPFLKTHDSDVLAYHQGKTRRGAYAAYLDVSHPDIEEFLVMRKPTGGDINRKALNLHHGVNINNKFIKAVEEDKRWDLIDPASKKVVKTINARELYFRILETRHQTGEPYICNLDAINDAMPEELKAQGLYCHGSNLCSEITLPTSKDRTAVCCLSSVNLEKYDEWCHDVNFIADIVRFLDNVLEYFVIHGNSLEKAAYSAYMERSIGIGALGFHAYLQKNMIPFESALASAANRRMFKHIKDKALEATYALGKERGEANDMVGSGKRNAHLLAIAPNASSSIYGNTSPSVEPWKANAFSQRTSSGTFLVKNRYLDELLKKKAGEKEADRLWKSILTNRGSVQHLDILDQYEKDVFKTAIELDQNWVVQHALDRQPFICQAQSINLFFPAEVDISYLHSVHWRAIKGGLKTLYYLRSEAITRAENVSVQIERDFITDPDECLSCSG